MPNVGRSPGSISGWDQAEQNRFNALRKSRPGKIASSVSKAARPRRGGGAPAHNPAHHNMTRRSAVGGYRAAYQ
ncbi:MAG: hypothetical protein AB7S38_40955 [Vulcanimicrobiota bacterium]